MCCSDIVQEDDPWVRLFAAHWRRNEVTVRRAVGGALLPSQSLKPAAKKRARDSSGNTDDGFSTVDKLVDAQPQRRRTSSVQQPAQAGNKATAADGAVSSATVPAPSSDLAQKRAPVGKTAVSPSPLPSSGDTGGSSAKLSRESDLTRAVVDTVLLRRSSLLHWCQRGDFSALVTGALVRIAEPSGGNRRYYTGLVTGAFEFRQPYVVHGSGNVRTKQGLLIRRTDGHGHTVRLHGVLSTHLFCIVNTLTVARGLLWCAFECAHSCVQFVIATACHAG